MAPVSHLSGGWQRTHKAPAQRMQLADRGSRLHAASHTSTISTPQHRKAVFNRMKQEHQVLGSLELCQSSQGQGSGLLASQPSIDGPLLRVPLHLLLSHNLPGACPCLLASGCLQRVFTSTLSWEIKIGAALLWAESQPASR